MRSRPHSQQHTLSSVLTGGWQFARPSPWNPGLHLPMCSTLHEGPVRRELHRCYAAGSTPASSGKAAQRCSSGPVVACTCVESAAAIHEVACACYRSSRLGHTRACRRLHVGPERAPAGRPDCRPSICRPASRVVVALQLLGELRLPFLDRLRHLRVGACASRGRRQQLVGFGGQGAPLPAPKA
jgi:hypothetical protein